jgi:putative ABC transport system permease protein
MARLAHRNLLHDKARFAVTLAGIAFAIVLVVVQLGLFIGFTLTTSSVIDHSGADVWICARGVQYFEVGFPLPERKRYLILATPGVVAAAKYIVKFTTWRCPDGAQKNVEIIGFDLESHLGAPWHLTAGSLEGLRAPDSILIDEFYAPELGVSRVGDLAEINGYRARIVGFTSGHRSFTTTPFVFTSLKNALNYTSSREDEPTFLLVRAGDGTAPQALKARLAQLLPDVDVNTTSEFSAKTRRYWLFTTGAGIALLVAALLGLLVGTAIVGQTIYAITVDHLRDFGILKAIGASDAYVYGVIIEQAVISAVVGYVLGIAASFALMHFSRNAGAMIIAPWQLIASMFFLALVMCIGASVISIHKVTRLDPAMVFKA